VTVSSTEYSEHPSRPSYPLQYFHGPAMVHGQAVLTPTLGLASLLWTPKQATSPETNPETRREPKGPRQTERLYRVPGLQSTMAQTPELASSGMYILKMKLVVSTDVFTLILKVLSHQIIS
jgi:hypothetical protein